MELVFGPPFVFLNPPVPFLNILLTEFLATQNFSPVDKASPQAKWVLSVLLSGRPGVQVCFLTLLHPTPSPDRSVLSWSCHG